MPIAAMREFARLRAAGEPAIEQRLRLLFEHRTALREQLAQLEGHEAALSAKIVAYRSLLAGNTTTPREEEHHD